MKITILQGAFLPVPPILGGAVEKMWFELGKEFVRMGHSVTHISREYEELPVNETIDGVTHLRVPGYATPSSIVRLKVLDLFYTLRALRAAPDADILITNTHWAPIFAAHRKGAVMVDVQRMPKGQMRWYRRSACLRANSTPVEKAILAEDAKAVGRTVMIPNPLPFIPNTMPDWESKEDCFLYVGRLHPEKGIELLLEAFTAFKAHTNSKWKLLIVGPYETAQGGGGKAWKERLQTRFSTTPDIEWIEPIFVTDKLNEIYAKAKMFIYPSLAEKGETFGLAPLEAMAWGCVPLVSDLECFKDFIRHGENGYIFDHRSTQASQNLAEALSNPISATDASQALKVRSTHSISRIAESFLTTFKSILKN